MVIDRNCQAICSNISETFFMVSFEMLWADLLTYSVPFDDFNRENSGILKT
jgi:hypothetical protein